MDAPSEVAEVQERTEAEELLAAEVLGFSDEQVEHIRKMETEKVKSDIPWWTRMDIDRWQQHLMNGTEEEAEGSWAGFKLLSDKPGCLIVEAHEADVLLIISSKEGVTFIKCYGENGCQTYVGIQEDFHEVYVTIPKRG